MAEKQAKKREGALLESAHRHPAEAGKEVREEVAFVSSSITEPGDEGCAEHYFRRFVQVDQPNDEEQPDLSLLREAVLGSVILIPRFRSPWKRRFP